MQLIQIVRYPVKSLQGEILASADIDADGLRGDRAWGIRDETTGKILTARRAPELLFAAAVLTAEGTPIVTLPGGVRCEGSGPDTDAALSAWLAKPVRLVSSLAVPPGRAEFFADATDDSSEAIEWTMPAGRFVDALPLLVLTTASLRSAAALHPAGDWHVRRFRPNLVVTSDEDGWLEDSWCGSSTLHVGGVALTPEQLCVRCTMVTRPQPGLDADVDIFRTLARHHGGLFGAWSSVHSGGVVRVGDDVQVEPHIVRQPTGASADSRQTLVPQQAASSVEPA